MKEYRPPYALAILAALGIWAIYVVTLAPTTAFWDTSEYIATAHILGIPHPPGNPLFVALGRVWSTVLAGTDLPVAVRINLLAATTSAVASFFYYLVAHRLLLVGEEDGWRPRLGAAAAVLLGGTAFTVWSQSNVNEKVYTLSLAVVAAVIWLGLRWRDRRHEEGSHRLLLWAVYLMALGSTNHLMSLLPLPALCLMVATARPCIRYPGGVWLRGPVLVLVGISFNLFLPIRSAQMPVINEGQPTCDDVVGTAVAVATLGQGGCPALAGFLTREQYGKPPVTDRQAPFSHQLLNWYQYFDWQWARGLDPSPLPGGSRTPVTFVLLGLGLLGLAVVARGDGGLFWTFLLLMATLTVALVGYLNFRFGYSLAPEILDARRHEVRERDYFFVAGFQLWGIMAGVGLVGVARWMGRWTRAPGWSASVLAVALVPLLLNAGWADRSEDHAARDWAYNLLQSVAPYGILLTNGDNDTFPLWYLQEVEGIRRDVTVVVVQYLSTAWYPEQLRHLTHPDRQRFPETRHRSGVHPMPDAPPSRPVFLSSPEEIAALQGGRVGEDFRVPVGEVALSFPTGSYLTRGELITLLLLSENWGERPFYFAATTDMSSSLGLDGWTVKEGLAHRFLLEPPGTLPGVVRVSQALGADWLDLNRSLALAQEVFSYRGFRGRSLWPDLATASAPWHLHLLHRQLAEAVETTGRGDALGQALQEEAQAFLLLAQGGEDGTSSAPGSSR